jgi:hypothetical protein
VLHLTNDPTDTTYSSPRDFINWKLIHLCLRCLLLFYLVLQKIKIIKDRHIPIYRKLIITRLTTPAMAPIIISCLAALLLMEGVRVLEITRAVELG